MSRVSFAIDLGFAKADGGQPGAFLDYAATARSLGMGRAHTAIADDAGAMYWNPSGLSQVERKDFVALYSVMYEDTGYGFFSFAQPTPDMGTFGLGLVTLRSQNFEKRDANRLQIGSFSNSELAVLFSHGVSVGSRWSLGSTVKVVRHEIDTYSGTGYGADISAMYKISPAFQTGFVVSNALAPRIRLKIKADEYPRQIRVGFKFQPGQRFLLATDLAKFQDRGVKLLVGTEWKLNKVLSLRTGINESEMTAGLGFQVGEWGLDYAFGYHDAVKGVSDLGPSHRLGFHIGFGGKASEQAVSLRLQKKGKALVESLEKKMNEADSSASDEEIQKLVAATRQLIRRQGYTNPQDLYTAQGYVYYFQREFERSVQSLGEALALDPLNQTLTRHLEKARAQLTEERTKEIVAFEIKRVRESYGKGDFTEAIRACDKILSFRPGDAEASAYLEDARRRLREPIDRELKIAKTCFGRGEYLDAIKSLQRVKEMDPNSKEAAELVKQSIAALEKQAAAQSAVAPSASKEAVFEIQKDVAKSRDYYSQGLLLYSKGKLKEAIGAWDHALKFDQDNTLARNAYNRVLTELKENR